MTDNEEIHGDIYAWTALIIVPIKALLNPVLFTLLTIVQPQVSHNMGRNKVYHAHMRIQRGEGVWGPENLQNIGFLRKTDPDPLKNHNAAKPVFNNVSSLACQRNAI